MTPSDTASHVDSDSARLGTLSSIVSRVVSISLLALLLVVVAACGDDDDDGTQPGQETGSPTNSVEVTASPLPTASGDGNGQTTAPPTGSLGDQSPSPGTTNSGTAIIAGVRYDITVNSCSVKPDNVFIIGGGLMPDGRPFIAIATWYEMDFFGSTNVVELVISTNVFGLLEDPEHIYKMGKSDTASTIDSIDLDVTAFSVDATGTFLDHKAPSDPPVEGSFTLSCSEGSA